MAIQPAARLCTTVRTMENRASASTMRHATSTGIAAAPLCHQDRTATNGIRTTCGSGSQTVPSWTIPWFGPSMRRRAIVRWDRASAYSSIRSCCDAKIDAAIPTTIATNATPGAPASQCATRRVRLDGTTDGAGSGRARKPTGCAGAAGRDGSGTTSASSTSTTRGSPALGGTGHRARIDTGRTELEARPPPPFPHGWCVEGVSDAGRRGRRGRVRPGRAGGRRPGPSSVPDHGLPALVGRRRAAHADRAFPDEGLERHDQAHPDPRRRDRRHAGREPAPQGPRTIRGDDHRRRHRRPPRVPARAAVRPVRAHRSRRHRPAARRAAAPRHRVPPVRRGARRPRREPRPPGRRHHGRLRRPRRRHRLPARPGGDRGPDRAGLDGAGLHLLRRRRRDGPRRRAGCVRRRPPGGQRRRPAHQVPGRAPRVLLPRRLVLPRARHPRRGHDHLRHTARRRVHQARRVGDAERDARRTRHRARHRVQHRHGRRRRRPARQLRRARGPVRSRRRGAGAQRRGVRRPIDRSRRRPRLRDDRRAHAPVEGAAERLRDRRRREPAHLQGRIGDALRGRGARREHPAVPAGRAPRRLVRRPRELLHRDRVPQGDAHRLQLRAGARRRSLPRPRRRPAARRVPPQPPREADVPVVLLARPAARPGPARHPVRHATRRQGPAAARPSTAETH